MDKFARNTIKLIKRHTHFKLGNIFQDLKTNLTKAESLWFTKMLQYFLLIQTNGSTFPDRLK